MVPQKRQGQSTAAPLLDKLIVVSFHIPPGFYFDLGPISVRTLRPLLTISGHEDNSSDHSNRSQDRWQWNRFMLIGGGVNWTDVHHVLVFCVANTLVYEGQDPKHHQRQSDKGSASDSGLQPCNRLVSKAL